MGRSPDSTRRAAHLTLLLDPPIFCETRMPMPRFPCFLLSLSLLLCCLPCARAEEHEVCPDSPGLFGRCTVAAAALPTKLCSIGSDGNLNISDCLSSCDPGWNCPRVSSCWPGNVTPVGNPWAHTPAFCPPTIACATRRLGSAYCDAAQGMYEPFLCPPGSYCPDSVAILPCPEGTFCLRGSVAPTDCGAFSYCPAGTEFRRFYGGLLLCLLLDVVLVGLFCVTKFYVEPFLRTSWSSARKARRELDFYTLPEGLAAFARDQLQRNGLWGSSSSSSSSGGAPDASAAALLSDSPEDEYVELGSSKQLGGGSTPSLSRAGSSADVSGMLTENFRRANGGACRFDIEFENFGFEVSTPAAPEAVAKGKGARRRQQPPSSSSSPSPSSLCSGLLPPMSKHTILRAVSGRIQSGKLTAIMGPSGAGKTSFLKCLFGKEPATKGSKLFINGKPGEMSAYKKVSTQRAQCAR